MVCNTSKNYPTRTFKKGESTGGTLILWGGVPVGNSRKKIGKRIGGIP